MLWRVRTTMADRPGTLARLAARCGDRGVNILGLQIFPDLGSVTDELVLAAPDEWESEDVTDLVVSAGGTLVAAARCSERGLSDPATRYLRAAAHLLTEPSALPEALADLLDADTAARTGADQDVLRLEAGGAVTEVRRTVPFTEVERARATALAQFPHLAAARREEAGEARVATGPVTPSGAGWSVRPGRPSDLAAVRRMHGRCSTDTLFRRYHSSPRDLSSVHATWLLEPEGGTSFVAAVEDEVVGMVVLAPYGPGVMEVGVLVEDGWQRQGVGTALVRAAARHAGGQGIASMLAIMQPDNRSLLPMLRRCGMTCLVRTVDGAAHVTIPLARFVGTAPSAAPADTQRLPAS